jgi:hypothetical protein
VLTRDGKFTGDTTTNSSTAETAPGEKCKENYEDWCDEECQQQKM